MPTLNTLLNDYKTTTETSFTRMAARCGIPTATMTWMASKEPPVSIRPEVVDKIAAGLGLPHREVTLAAIESAGYQLRPLDETGRLDSIGVELNRLSDEDWHLVRSLIVRLANG